MQWSMSTGEEWVSSLCNLIPSQQPPAVVGSVVCIAVVIVVEIDSSICYVLGFCWGRFFEVRNRFDFCVCWRIRNIEMWRIGCFSCWRIRIICVVDRIGINASISQLLSSIVVFKVVQETSCVLKVLEDFQYFLSRFQEYFLCVSTVCHRFIFIVTSRK